MKAGIITFPGSNCDKDIGWVLNHEFQYQVDYIWHRDSFALDYDLIVLPGGFSYGDYLRCGAIARFSKAMNSVFDHVKSGRKLLGICNGFQILTESHLLPGALILNHSRKYICKTVILQVHPNHALAGLIPNQTLEIPIAHSEGRYHADPDTISDLQQNSQIAFQYANNPNGSIADIAGISSRDGKILGMMPHPERAVDALTDNLDGKPILKAFIEL